MINGRLITQPSVSLSFVFLHDVRDFVFLPLLCHFFQNDRNFGADFEAAFFIECGYTGNWPAFLGYVDLVLLQPWKFSRNGLYDDADFSWQRFTAFDGMILQSAQECGRADENDCEYDKYDLIWLHRCCSFPVYVRRYYYKIVWRISQGVFE